MSWIRDIHGNYVSIASVATGTPINTRAGERRVELKDAHGRTLGVVFEAELQPREVTLAGPIACACISRTGEVAWCAVAGWRITPHGAEAVLAGSRPSGCRMFLEFNTGELIGLDCGRRHPDLEEENAAVCADDEGREVIQ